jgi:hypothetical protein
MHKLYNHNNFQSAVLKNFKYDETIKNEVRNIYRYEHLYRVDLKLHMQDISRIRIRIILRWALVDTIRGDGLD